MKAKINSLLNYFKYLSNPVDALIFKFGFKKECEVQIKNTKTKIRINNIFTINRLMHRLPTTSKSKYDEFINYINELNEDKKVITIDNIKYVNTDNTEFKSKHPQHYNTCIDEFFSEDQWNMIQFENRHVIDIGGNVADTALYFAKEGATVIGFEPVKHLYELGLENISLNPNLKNRITFINNAVGGKKGKLNINTESTSEYVNDEDSYEIEVITVSDVLNEYEFPADVLKMDCEGCEFEIIKKEDLSMFNDIVFEHHSKLVGKDYKPLISTLKNQGFSINTYPCNASGLDFEDIGIIHAYK